MNLALGPVKEGTVTILFNSQEETPKAAGAVDLTFNPDNDPNTFPPFNTSPGANNSVSGVEHDTNGNVIVVGRCGAFIASQRRDQFTASVNYQW